MNYWLMKSEPDSYSFDDLVREGRTAWSGVRNFQARNYMSSQQVGDRVLFYHSNCAQIGVVGIAKLTSGISMMLRPRMVSGSLANSE